MKTNLGILDRLIRVILAVLLVVLYFTGIVTGLIGGILLTVAIIFLLTGLVSFCPIYALFGLQTKKTKAEAQ